MRTRTVVCLGVVFLLAGCTGGSGGTSDGPTGPTGPTGPISEGGGPTCGLVRLTGYDDDPDQGWCGFRETTHPMQRVRDHWTIAIAEPYDGGSYGGAPGEACGECWEVDTIWGTPQILMVSNLCPADGNIPCQGAFFHFDLRPGAVTALGGDSSHSVGTMDAAVARRVACPVADGGIKLEIYGRNEYGDFSFQVVNHRIPVRRIEFKPQGSTQWFDANRIGGRWQILNNSWNTFLSTGPGGTFRITSAQGQTVESTKVLKGTDTATVPFYFDLGGVQFTDLEPTTGPQCTFEPPGDVYVDGWGGIPGVKWELETAYAGAALSETTSGCSSGSCLKITGLKQYAGFRIRYRQGFPTSTFTTLSMKVKAASGSGSINIEPSNEADICQETVVTPGTEWQTVTITLSSVCSPGTKYGAKTELNAVTISKATSGDMTLLLDDVRFQ